MRTLDYLYLDTVRLSDYMAALDPGVLRELRETTRQVQGGSKTEPFLDEAPADSGKPKSESTQERVLSASEKSSFNRLYGAIDPELKKFDEYTEIDLAAIERRGLIEITRDFEPSPLSQMIDSLLDFAKMAQQVGAVDLEVDQEAKEAIHGITMLFRGSGEEQKEVPVVSAAGSFSTSVFFMVQRKYVLRGIDELEGESTLVGRVEKVVPEGKDVDLFDLLKILPRSLRRGKTGDELKASLKEMFRTWPQELGGPVSDDAFSLPGPLVIVSPLAVFR